MGIQPDTSPSLKIDITEHLDGVAERLDLERQERERRRLERAQERRDREQRHADHKQRIVDESRRAAELRRQGLTYQQIASKLGVGFNVAYDRVGRGMAAEQ